MNENLYLGGYNLVNSAKLWTRLTAVIAKQKLPSEIPDHNVKMQYFPIPTCD